MSVNVQPLFDAASSSGYEATLSTYNWTHKIGLSLPNRCLTVTVSIVVSGTVSTITLGAQSLSLVRADANGVYRTEIWRLVNPTEGSGTITVNLSGSLTSIANAASYYNVDPTTPVEAQNTAQGASASAAGSVTPLSRLALVVGGLTVASASGVTSAAGQNSRAINAGALGTGALDDKGPVDPASSTTLTWTGLGAISNTWVMSLIALKPAPTPSVGFNVRPRIFGPGIAR